MKKGKFFLLSLLSIIFIGSPNKSKLEDKSYKGAASIGDLVGLELGAGNVKLSFLEGKLEGKTLESSLENIEGFPEHVYRLKEHPETTVIITPEVIVYETTKEYGNYGVALVAKNEKYDTTKIQGTYNYVSQDKMTGANFGTIQIKEDNTWASFFETTPQGTNTTFEGTYVDDEKGIIHAKVTKFPQNFAGKLREGDDFANLIFSANGGDLLIADLVALEGIMLSVKQSEITKNETNGEYIVVSPGEDKAYKAQLENGKLTYKDRETMLGYNKPWPGLLAGSMDEDEIKGVAIKNEFRGIISKNNTFFGINELKIYANDLSTDISFPSFLFTAIKK